MNIQFKSIDISNFRSIEHIRVDLSNQGIVIVKGINEYEDKATSNGSGKSSIFESIIYALFEETSSGEKNVSNRITGQGYKVKLEFDIDNNQYVIIREGTNSKSSVLLYKNDVDISCRNKTDTNKQIEQLLGISKSIFLDSIFLSQNANTNLSTLSPTARKERLEILTNTDQAVNRFKEQIKLEQQQYEFEKVSKELELNKLIGNKEVFQNQINQYNQKILEIDEQIRQRDQLGNIEDVEQKIQNLQHNLIHIPEQIQDYENTLIPNKEQEILEARKLGEGNINKKAELNIQISQVSSQINTYTSEINNSNNMISQCNRLIQQYNQEINKVKNSDTCPTCGRKYENIDSGHIQSVIQEYQDKINIEQQNIQQQMILIDTNSKHIEQIQSQVSDLQSQLMELENEISEFNKHLVELENEKQNLNTEKSNLQSEKLSIENNINQLRDLKEQILSFKVGNKQEIETMKQEIETKMLSINVQEKEINDCLAEQQNYIEACKHSIQLITKDFRTYLLQTSIQYLNKQLHKYSAELFSNEKDLIQISDNDTKLDIKLGNAPYESLSGGEKTRVNIALLLAQKSLANIIGNINCNLIILDEILGYCDAQAETNVVDLITTELNTLESIYMISHKEIPIGYDSELVVIKNKEGLTNLKTY